MEKTIDNAEFRFVHSTIEVIEQHLLRQDGALARAEQLEDGVHLGRLEDALAELGRMLAIQPGVTMASFRANSARDVAPEYIEPYVAAQRLAGLPAGGVKGALSRY
jgi:hypothetical protein